MSATGGVKEDNNILRKEVIAYIRSILVSSKGDVPLDEVHHEYKSLIGEGIPFRKFGYSSLEEFLSHTPELCTVVYPGGIPVVRVVVSESTAHISQMVAMQKNKKKVKPARRPLGGARSWQPPVSMRGGGRGGRGGGTGGSQRYHQPFNRQQQSFAVGGSGRLPLNHNNNNNARPLMMMMTTTTASRGGGGRRFGAGRPHQLRAPTNDAHPLNSKPNMNRIITTTPPMAAAAAAAAAGIANATTNRKQSKNTHYVKELEKYFADNKLEAPEFKTAEMGSKKSRSKSSFVSAVIVNERTFRTFPNEYPTKELAEEAAAKLAIEALSSSSSSISNNKNAQNGNVVTADIDQVIDRIIEIVGKRANGVWSTQIEVEYKAKHKDLALPENWQEKINPSRHRLRVDSPIPGRYIVVPCLIDENQQLQEAKQQLKQQQQQQHEKQEKLETPPIQKLCLNNSSQKKQIRPPPLVCPDETYWDVYVTVVASTTNVITRLLGENYHEKFDDLSTDMELFYYDYNKIPCVTNPQIGYLYAARLDTDWHRVEVINVHGIDVTCYLIDHGDEDIIKVQDLREIDPKFLQLPAQAKPIKLAGLDDYADDETALNYLKNAISGRSLVAEVISRGDDEIMEPPSLILYDTSTDEDVNINKKLLELLGSLEVRGGGQASSSSSSSSSSNLLPEVGGEIIPVFLSYISSSGDLFVQKETSTFNLIEKLIDETSDKIMANDPPKVLDQDKIYLTRYHLNNQLYRAALLTTQVKDGKVSVNFIDYGNTEIVNSSELREVESAPKLLAEAPSQALKCRLAGVLPSPAHTWTNRASEKLRELVPEEKQVQLKVISNSGSVPEVELFEKKSDLGEELISINKIISGLDLFDLNEDTNNNKSTRSLSSASTSSSSVRGTEIVDQRSALQQQQQPARVAVAAAAAAQAQAEAKAEAAFPVPVASPLEGLLSLDLASLKSLFLPFVPGQGEFFDVTVSLAASPSNFMVQSWAEESRLEAQQQEMNEFYCNALKTKAYYKGVTIAELAKDQFFAALHTDGFWYRVKVDKILDNFTIAVKFVDYGDYSMVVLQNIQPLWPQFRNLPMQAIKATLADIIPTNGDWTPDDTIWFNKRVVDKQFVSIIKDVVIEDDDTIKIGVSLIDTTHPRNDIYVEKQLVDDGRAVYLCV